MTVYYTQTFDAASLPGGFTSLNGTQAASNTQSYYGGGHYSLKITSGSTQVCFFWFPTPLDTNHAQTQVSFKFYYDATPAAALAPIAYLLGTSGPSGSNKPPLSVNGFASVWTGGSGVAMGSANSPGSTNTALPISVAQSVFTTAGTWTSGLNKWYQLTLSTQPSFSGGYYRTALYVQRLSDSTWLHRDGTWQTGAQTAVLVNQYQFYPNNNFANWYAGTFPVCGVNLSSGINFYVNDLVYQDAPAVAGAVPASPPAAGNEVELTVAPTGSDAGIVGYDISKLNDGTVRDQYCSLGNYDAWLLYDTGAGNAVTPTAALFSPGWLYSNHFTSTPNQTLGFDEFSLGLAVEGASSTSGPWTALGNWATNDYPQCQYLNTLRLDPNTPGGTYRYLRVRAPLDPCCLSQCYVLANNTSLGTTTWRPARPILNPAAGTLPAGTTVTITSATSGATIFYTTDGTTPAQTAGSPTGTTQTYSTPITPATNGPATTVIKAMAYHASGTTTNSAVVTGTYIVSTNGEIVFDSGTTGATVFGTSYSQAQNWPGPMSDCVTGQPLNAHDGMIYYDGADYWFFGNNINTPFGTSYGHDNNCTLPRGCRLYQGVSLGGAPAYKNWKYVGLLLPPMPNWYLAGTTNLMGNQSREKVLVNPSPLDANKKYVIWQHIGTGSVTQDGYMSYTSPTFPNKLGWTPAGSVITTIGGLSNYGDSTTFYDVVDDTTGHSRNKAWVFFTDNGNNNVYCFQLDPATDWVSTTGAGFTIPLPSAYEGLSVIHENGYYYIIASASTPYGSGNTLEKYISGTTLAAGATWSAAASIWSSAASAPSVAYSVQSFFMFQVPNLTANGYLFLCVIQDAFDSSVDTSHFWNAWLPVSTTTSGNAVNAFTSPGVLSLPKPTAWDKTYLPASAVTAQAWPYLDSGLSGQFTDMGLGGI